MEVLQENCQERRHADCCLSKTIMVTKSLQQCSNIQWKAFPQEWRLLLSRSDDSSFVFSLFQCWSGRELSGHSMFCVSMLGLLFGLIWFSIRGRCLSLSLIGNNIQVACFVLGFVGGCLLSLCLCTRQDCFGFHICCFAFCSVLIYLFIIKHAEH